MPQDVAGRMGRRGRYFFLDYLTGGFEKTPLTFGANEYWSHANEPGRHTAWELVMEPTPNEAWGTAPDDLPPRNFPTTH
jgi:hypothetical protein